MGLKFEEYFYKKTDETPTVFDSVKWKTVDSKITSPEGKVIFEMKDVEVPEGWSQLATDIMASKYCRKAGVLNDRGHEYSLKQIVDRIVETISTRGNDDGYFESPGDEWAFNNDLKWLLINQYGAFNSPVWFNVGLWYIYEIEGSGSNFAWDYEERHGADWYPQIENQYARPQSSACFIQSVPDTLEGIFELCKTEARLFKYGSGTGSNMSAIRGKNEKLSGGGYSSGLMSFLKVLDSAAGAIKSGGTCLTTDTPVLTEEGYVKVSDLTDKSFICFSKNIEKGTLNAKRATAFVTGIKDCVRVTTDKGVFEVSHDHPFLLKGGVYLAANEIKKGMRLDAAYTLISKDGYAQFNHDRLDGTNIRIHRMLAHDILKKEIKNKTVRHIDSDKLNNRLSNLKVAGSLKVADSPEKSREREPRDPTSRMMNRAYALLNAGHDISTMEKYFKVRDTYYLKRSGGGFSKKQRAEWTSAMQSRFKDYPEFYAELGKRNHIVVKVEPIGRQQVYDVQVECPSPETRDWQDNHNFLIGNSNVKLGTFEGRGVFTHNTRRAAVMRCLDADHPEIMDFIDWKVREEEKAQALIKAGYDSDFNGEAYGTVSGQNSNNSVRLTDLFMSILEDDGDWNTIKRTVRGQWSGTYKAKEIFDAICKAAWRCADPGVQYDTTINNWNTCSESARIRASNPCSEFMFLDDTACNLASLNLVKFYKDGKFDVESYRKACRIFFVAQDILVDLGSYPTRKIAENSHRFRPLGLGYTNLGTLLMLNGYPYDSDEGRSMAGLLTAIMTGEAYRTSAEMAEHLGAFAEYEKNKKPMSDVIYKHRQALGSPHYTIPKSVLNKGNFPHYLYSEAAECWADADLRGVKHGFRNSQATVLAPTGTIGLLMDCDTTGIEPAFSLIAYKKLAGGGVIKMVNQSVGEALSNLGYDQNVIKRIQEWVVKDFSIGDSVYLHKKHLPIFDCAVPAEEGGRSIAYMGHVKMLAAVQPFISGAISKTINMPKDSTPEDIAEVYMESWKLGLKSIAIYRDGSKGSQPLNTSPDEKEEKPVYDNPNKEFTEHTFKGVPFMTLEWGTSQSLPDKRKGLTWEFKVGGTKVFLRSGEYEDGKLGEVFIDLGYKEGSTVRSLMDQFAISISFCLQHGVGLEKLVDKFSFTKFEPHGLVQGHPYLKNATSLVDAIFRILGHHYLGREDFLQVKPESSEPRVDHKVVATTLSSTFSSDNNPCSDCGSTYFKKTGTCAVCAFCGTSQGCS